VRPGWVMKIDRPMLVSEGVFSALIRALNRCTRRLLPPEKRFWGEALIAEEPHIETENERLIWAAGGVSMTAKELLKKAAEDRCTWLTTFVLGTASALIELHSATRWPHIFLLFAAGLVLACWRPE
jgi:hypothetical protein